MTVVLRAPAKVTLSLLVTGVRPDGYHTVEAEMTSVDLCDTMYLDPSGDSLVVVAGGVERAGDPDDLVVRALTLAQRTAGVMLHKSVPPGAGLGGGSSDAAAILRWAGITDPLVAATVGADVAFCLVGGRARVSGIGEHVDPLPFVDGLLTLMTPPLHCSTPVVYGTWDEMGGPKGEAGNDLEPAALRAYPGLEPWRDDLAATTGKRPRLAGSGSTWFVEGSHPGPGRTVVRRIPSNWAGPVR